MNADVPDSTVALWSLTEPTLVEIGDDGDIVVVTPWEELELGHDALVAESLRRMALGPVNLSNATGSAADADGAPDTDGLRKALELLGGSVVRSLALGDGRGPILSVVPLESSARFRYGPVTATTPVRLSTFAAIRPDHGQLVLESPRASFHVVLARPVAVRIVSALAAPTTAALIAAELDLPHGVLTRVLAYLIAAGVVVAGDALNRFTEDRDPRLLAWTYHQMLFHVRGRERHDNVAGNGAVATIPAPLTRALPDGPAITLYRPDRAGAQAPAASLVGLLDSDQLAPAFSDRELPVERIGELLFHGARVRSVDRCRLPGRSGMLVSQRPYPSTDCLYELELYLTAHRCPGLAPGIYHYDPVGHALTLVNESPVDRATVLDLAMVAGAGHRPPAALLTVTARIGRTAWALDGAAYASALTHFGALHQTLHLTAQAIGLTADAVPLDSSDRVERALKLDWIEEAAVGTCILDMAE